MQLFQNIHVTKKIPCLRKEEEEQYLLQRLTLQMMAILTPPHPSAWETLGPRLLTGSQRTFQQDSLRFECLQVSLSVSLGTSTQGAQTCREGSGLRKCWTELRRLWTGIPSDHSINPALHCIPVLTQSDGHMLWDVLATVSHASQVV